MITFPFIIKPEAELDIEHAVNWYNGKRPGLGYEFLESVEKTFSRIRETPELHAIVHRNARLTLVKRFPYVICYLFDGTTVFVIAVFHGHRMPTAWKIRID